MTSVDPAKFKLVHKSVDQLTPTELYACYKLVRRLRGMYIGAHEGWDRQKKLSEMRDTEALEYLIYYYKGQVAAFASFTLNDYFDDMPCTFLWEIHVDPKFKRQGMGHQLINEVCDRVPKSAGTVLLRCFKSNHRARAFYEKEGFTTENSLEDEHSLYFKRIATK